MTKRVLYRIPEKGMIAGVAAGFADYFDMDVTLMRLLFVAVGLLSAGSAVLVYIVLAIVMPKNDAAKPKDFDISERADALAREMKENGRAQNIGNYFGIALVILGLWFLLGQFYPVMFHFQWNIIWPVLIVGLGLLILAKGRK